MKRIRTIAAILSSLSFGFHAGDLASQVAKKGNRQPKKPGVCVCNSDTNCGCTMWSWWNSWYPKRSCPCRRVLIKCEGCQ